MNADFALAGLIYGESPDDPEMRRTSEASHASFMKAMAFLGIPVEAVDIPCEDSAIPAYFFRSAVASAQALVLIVPQGMDASVEENLFLARAALERGHHALLFHHPGQGRALRERDLTFRLDWENVITPVMDFVVAQPGVDAARFALMSNSFSAAHGGI